MNRRIFFPILAAVAVLFALLQATVQANAATGRSTVSTVNAHVCGKPTAHTATCLAVRHDAVTHDAVTTDGKHNRRRQATPSGYGPADIQAAYHLSASGSGGTVAIVDAYDDPTAEQDLAIYRSQYGLPACTTANGCFHKVNQTGGTSYPRQDAGWAQEISLDLDMVSATCPSCHVVLVEAQTASFSDLAAAVNQAAKTPGVVAISNSYGGSDMSSMAAYDHPGIAITASTGDNGYGVSAPASFDSVIAVGGTSLHKSGSTFSESAWSGAGSGCSQANPKPAWQTAATQCSGKAIADVSAVADPNTGVSVYDSTPAQGYSGWMIFGGTSASSPIIASVYALSGNTAGYPAQFTWNHASALNDVTSGSNGTCSPSLWCHAGTGWDGPTGLGSPNGTAGF